MSLIGLGLNQFREAFVLRLKTALVDEDAPWTAAVDGRTYRQGLADNDSPVQMLNVFLQRGTLTPDQWSIGGDKTNEPSRLKTHLGELLSRESRYFVSSLDPESVTPHDLRESLRSHWKVENCLHFVKYRWWDEVRHYTKCPGLVEVFASLTSAALAVLRRIHPQTFSIESPLIASIRGP